jgi:hypothetical protein
LWPSQNIHFIKKLRVITAKKQSCDILAVAVSENQIDMDDFSAFEKMHESATDPNFQLTPGKDISENLTLSDTKNTLSNPRENQKANFNSRCHTKCNIGGKKHKIYLQVMH